LDPLPQSRHRFHQCKQPGSDGELGFVAHTNESSMSPVIRQAGLKLAGEGLV
jgi:hypothetical protein